MADVRPTPADVAGDPSTDPTGTGTEVAPGPTGTEAGAAGGRHTRMAHVPALDGLRGLAVAAVLWFHAGRLTGGYLGVDLFFVLSGYLITSLLVLEWRGTGRISLREFWARRARRLLPALFALIAVVGVAAHREVLPVARGNLRGAGLATMAYVANWYAIASGNGYWDRALQPSWLEHTWSLAIEEQFYVVWPLVVVALFAAAGKRARAAGAEPDAVTAGGARPFVGVGPRAWARERDRAIRRLGWLCLGGAALSAGLMIGWSYAGGGTERLYLGTDTRMAAILLGAWAACRQRTVGHLAPEGSGRRLLAGSSVVAALVLAAAWWHLDGADVRLYRGGLLVCGLAATLVILDVTNPGRSFVGAVASFAPFRWLGAISYGLYLWHWPIYQFLYPGRRGLEGWSLTGVRVGLSLVVAIVSFVVLERPIQQRRWPVPLLPLAPVAAALAVVAIVAGTTGAVSPVVDRGPGTESVAAVGDPVVMVVGDSVAYALSEEGLIPEADEGSGISVVDRAEIGCTLMREVDEPVDEIIRNCSPQWPTDVAAVRPDVVVLLFGGFVSIVPMPIGGAMVWPCEPAYDQLWERRLNESVDVLSADGATVLLVNGPTTANPQIKGDHGDAFDTRQRCANDVIARVADDRPEAQLIDLSGWICPDWPSCRGIVDGTDLRPDGVHFTGPGARTVATWLAPQLAAAAR